MKKFETENKRPIRANNKRTGLQGMTPANPGNTGAAQACCTGNSTCCDDDSISHDDCHCDTEPSSCCDTASTCEETSCMQKKERWMTGYLETPAGTIAQVSTKINSKDRIGTIKARLGINRMDYKVSPGIYAIGNPDAESPVLVTANYKLTFDKVRCALAGLDTWLMVLDTKGVNVWCAAGKGTFGTTELVRRIKSCNLDRLVSHRTLILPQLGATGVSAHETAKKTGFKVTYGPVRIQDVQEFIRSGSKATNTMRQVRFTMADRLVLTPIELYNAVKIAIPVLGILFLMNLILQNPFGWTDAYAYFGSLIAGCVLTPLLLPWIPGKAFAWKGLLTGLAWAFAVNALHGWPGTMDYGIFRALGYFLTLPAISAYYAMMFTGSSTYTSLSGVKKEMRIAVPILLGLLATGAILLV